MNDPLAALSGLNVSAWLVGGAVRDRLLGRFTCDYDIVIDGEPTAVARQLAHVTNAHVFNLSEGFAAWRVVARDRSWQVDVLALAGGSIEEDLERRDFTVNAIARPLAGGADVDPFAGKQDLHARRLRMVSDGAFREDPLRCLRLARLACELGFEVETRTLGQARADVAGIGRVPGERVFAELKRILAGGDRVIEGLALMDEIGITQVVLPELAGKSRKT